LVRSEFKMQTFEIGIDQLIPSARVLRKNDGAVARMMAVIKECGIAIPILARHLGDKIEIVDGHLRVKASRKMGLLTIPVGLLRRMDGGASERLPPAGEPAPLLTNPSSCVCLPMRHTLAGSSTKEPFIPVNRRRFLNRSYGRRSMPNCAGRAAAQIP
jgi:ParB-like nuclease domain